jgi:hypothetical protein
VFGTVAPGPDGNNRIAGKTRSLRLHESQHAVHLVQPTGPRSGCTNPPGSVPGNSKPSERQSATACVLLSATALNFISP